MHKVKFTSVLVLLALLVIAGLGAGIARGAPSSADESLDPQAQEYILNLVTRWLYEEDPHLEIEEEIRALSVEEARLSLLLNYTILRLGFPEDAPKLFTVLPDRQQYLLDLTRRALYSDEAVEDKINALSSEERDLFTDFTTSIQEITSGQGASHLSEHELLTIEVMLALMEKHNAGLLEIPEDEITDTLKEALLEKDAPTSGLEGDTSLLQCPPGYASCAATSFPYNTYRTGCAGWCIGGSGFDRTSNSACEEIACDYRIWFYTPEVWNGIDGSTSCADCVANGVPHGVRWSSRTEISVGYGRALYCLAASGSYLAANLRVER